MNAVIRLSLAAAAGLCLAVLTACNPPGKPASRAPEGALGIALKETPAVPPVAPAKPYVVIRFERPGLAYDDALYSAMSRALERYPAARFDVVLAMPPMRARADAEESLRLGEQHIEDVVLTMTDMGLPADRLRVAASTDDAVKVDEIRIFVR